MSDTFYRPHPILTNALAGVCYIDGDKIMLEELARICEATNIEQKRVSTDPIGYGVSQGSSQAACR